MFRFRVERLVSVVTLISITTVLAALLTIPRAHAADDVPYVTLEGRAILPADTFAAGPPSGAAVTGNTFGRAVPFASQPVQGISAVLPKWNGNYLTLSDNGFGAKGNSADFRLRWYEMRPRWQEGTVEVVGYSELHDPSKLVPFPLVNATGDRPLTGADFDPESFRQAPDGTFWFGEEFGPYLLHTDVTGRLLEAPIPTPFPAALRPFTRGLPFVQSPEHPAFTALPTADARRAAANLPSSRGFEGMALNTSGTRLYPLLEGALLDDPIKTRLLIQEFDLATRQYTGAFWFYPLEQSAHAIGDMTAFNDHEFLVIERDNNEGTAARFKRVYKIDLWQARADGTLPKQLVMDLMAITDRQGITRPAQGAIGLGPIFTFPFTTIESVFPIDDRTLLIIDDNNYPFSSGRRPGVAPDDTEFIKVRLPTPLNRARTTCGSRPDCSAQ